MVRVFGLGVFIPMGTDLDRGDSRSARRAAPLRAVDIGVDGPLAIPAGLAASFQAGLIIDLALLEEFAILVPDLSVAEVTAIVARIRASLDDDPPLFAPITFSAGLALDRSGELVAEADGARYRAKAAGRRTTVTSESPVGRRRDGDVKAHMWGTPFLQGPPVSMRPVPKRRR